MKKMDSEEPYRKNSPGGPARAIDPLEYIKAARTQLRRGNNDQAYTILMQGVVDYPDNVLILSYYGCLHAVVDHKFRSGVDACRKAIALFKAPDKYSVGVIYPILYLNLGRACLASGRKQEAVDAFRKGLNFDKGNRELNKELQILGIRKKPAVPFLSRSNPINKYIGMLLHGNEKSVKSRASQ